MKKIMARFSRHPYGVDDRFRDKVGELWLESIKNFAPDVIVVEYAPNIPPKFMERARQFGKPIIYWMTSPPDGFQSKEVLLSMGSVDHIATIDRDWMHFLKKFAPTKTIHHIPLAGDETAFKPLMGHEEAEKNSQFDIVFVGSFTPQDASASWRGMLLNSLPRKYKVGVFGGGADYWKPYFPYLHEIAQPGGLSTGKIERVI